MSAAGSSVPRPRPVNAGADVLARRCRAAAAADGGTPRTGQGRRTGAAVGHADPGIVDRADRRPHGCTTAGHDAAKLARSRSLEEVAALIWTGRLETPARSAVARSDARSEAERERAVRHARAVDARGGGAARSARVRSSGRERRRDRLANSSPADDSRGDRSASQEPAARRRARAGMGRRRRGCRHPARGARAVRRSRIERVLVHRALRRVRRLASLCGRHRRTRGARRAEARRRERACGIDARRRCGGRARCARPWQLGCAAANRSTASDTPCTATAIRARRCCWISDRIVTRNPPSTGSSRNSLRRQPAAPANTRTSTSLSPR